MIGKLDSNGLLLGWYEDTDTIEEPKVTVTEEVWQQALEINANKYVDGNFVFEDLRTDEQKAIDIRNERNWLLEESDWTQIGDIPQATKDAWATYRQSLRDVPQQESFPTSVTFPTKPN